MYVPPKKVEDLIVAAMERGLVLDEINASVYSTTILSRMIDVINSVENGWDCLARMKGPVSEWNDPVFKAIKVAYANHADSICDDHSGPSFCLMMSQMQQIAKIGYDAFVKQTLAAMEERLPQILRNRGSFARETASS